MNKQYEQLKVIDGNWLNTPSAKEYVSSILQQNERRHFGLLERPSLPPSRNIDIIKYKIFLCGKSGVGKTATVANFSGSHFAAVVNETGGIETTNIYWPARLITTGKLVFFCLQFWDVGDHATKKFDHILPSCLSEVDLVLFTFSLTDRSSFSEIPQLINRTVTDDGKQAVQAVLATKADQFIHSDISEKEMQNFSELRKIPILKIKNKSSAKGVENIREISIVLNKLCDMLLQRDQKLAATPKEMSSQISDV